MQGEGQYVWDHTGKRYVFLPIHPLAHPPIHLLSPPRYLDCVNNVAHLGHSHPALANAASLQLRLINTNTRYHHPGRSRYAKKLLALFPPELDTVFFVNSGSEANDLALALARAYTGYVLYYQVKTEQSTHPPTCVSCADQSSWGFYPTTYTPPNPPTHPPTLGTMTWPSWTAPTTATPNQ